MTTIEEAKKRQIQALKDKSSGKRAPSSLNAAKQRQVAFLQQKQAAKLQEKIDYYNSLKNNADWEELSQKSAADASFSRNHYNYSLGSEIASDVWDHYVFGLGSKQMKELVLGNKESYYDEYKQMTDEQKAILNYLTYTDRDKADEYFDDLRSGLKEKAFLAEKEKWKNFGDEHAVLGSIASVGTNLLSVGDGIKNLMDGVSNAIAGDGFTFDTYDDKYTHMTNSLREGASADMSGLGKFVYNVGMSMADNIARAPLGAVGAGIVAMGQGLSQGIVQGKEMGMSDGKAALYGIIVGAAEGLTEKFSVDKLLDKTQLAKSAKGYILKNIIAEGSEEAVSEVVAQTSQMILAGDEAEWRKLYNDYINKGYSKAGAVGLAVANTVGLAALSGALSGGGMAGGSIALNTAVNVPKNISRGSNINLGANANSDLLAAAEAAKSPRIDKTVNKLTNAKTEIGQNYQRGKLYQQVFNEAQEKLHPYGDETETKNNGKPTHDAKVATKKLNKENEMRKKEGKLSVAEEFAQSEFGQKYKVLKEKIKKASKYDIAMDLKTKSEDVGYHISEDGKTYTTKRDAEQLIADKEVEISELAEIKGGIAQVKLSDGSVVPATELLLSEADAKAYTHAAAHNDTATAKAFLDGLKNYEGSIEQYAEEFETAYSLGLEANGRTLTEMVSTLPKSKRNQIIKNDATATAFEAGKRFTKKANNDSDKMKKARDAKKSRSEGDNKANSSIDQYASISDIVSFIDSVRSMKDLSQVSKRRKKLGVVSSSHAEIIKRLTGIDVSEYEIWIDGSAVLHINERHGENGKADKSMSDTSDVARVAQVANNADGGEIITDKNGKPKKDYTHKNKDGTPSPMVKLYNREGNSLYYVVECVPDSVQRRIFIKSAYKQKSGKGQELNIVETTPQQTPKALLDSNTTVKKQHISPLSDVQASNPTSNNERSMNTVSKDSISEKSEKVNISDEKNSANKGKNKKTAEKGKLIISDEVEVDKLTATQKKGIERLEILAACLNDVTIIVEDEGVDAGNKNKYRGDNGFYSPTDNTIHISVNAGKVSVDGMFDFALSQTLSHETLHFIREHSEADYQALKNFLKKNVYTPTQWNARVVERLNQYYKGDPDYYDDAEEEVVANSLQTMFNSPRVLNALAKENLSLTKRIKLSIANFFDKLIRKLSDNVNYTVEARTVMQSAEKTQKELEKKFIEALRNVRNNTETNAEATQNTEIERESKTVKASKREGENNTQIKIGMTDNERADILKKQVISPQKINVSENFDIDFEHLQNDQLKIVKSSLVKKLRELGHLKKYQTNNVDVEFEFTAGGLKKSMNSQVYEYGGSLADLAKVVMNMQTLLDSSVLLEIHSDKAVGSPKENPQLVQTYVLLSVFLENGEITPVQFEVKQYIDNENRLYLAVALTKIETDVISDTMLDKNQTSTRLLPVSNISIPDLIQKINPRDKNFFKYIPDEFLSESQLEAKQRALKIEDAKYNRDKIKSSKREGETLTARDMILDSLANEGVNGNERRSIEAYRKRVDRIDSLVKARSEVNRELTKILNDKGSEAAARRSILQIQKKNLTRSIEREEIELSKQEGNSRLKKVVTEVILKRIQLAAERQDMAEVIKYSSEARQLYDKRMNERLSSEERKRIREGINEYKEKRKRQMTKKELIEKLKKLYDKYFEMLDKPSENAYVPKELIKSVCDLLSLLDFDTGYYEKTKMKRGLSTKLRREEIRNRLADIKGQVGKMAKNSPESDKNGILNEDPHEAMAARELQELLDDDIEYLRDLMNENKLADIDPEELQLIYEILREMDTSLSEARKLKSENLKVSAQETAQEIANKLIKIRSRKKGKLTKVISTIDNSITNQALDVMENVNIICDYDETNPLRLIFDILADGHKRERDFNMNAYKIMEPMTTGENAKYFKKAQTEANIYLGKNQDGKDVNITETQLISLLMTVKCEDSNPFTKHVFDNEGNGEIHVADPAELAKGHIGKATEKSHIIKITRADITRLEGQLSAWGKQYMSSLREAFDMSSLQMYRASFEARGYPIELLEEYFPFAVDKGYLVQEIGENRGQQGTLKDLGLLKSRTRGSRTPLVLLGADFVLKQHLGYVSKYVGLATPVSDFNKIWNSVVTDQYGNKVYLFKFFENTIGKAKTNLLKTAVKDMQSRRLRSDPENETTSFLNNVTNAYYSAIFTLNFMSAFKQQSSLWSAMSILNWRDPVTVNIIKAEAMAKQKKIFEEADKYTSALWERRQGLSTRELGDIATAYESNAIMELAKKIPTSKLLQWADVNTACAIWLLAKNDIQKTGKYKEGSEEFFREVATLFETVMEKTQVTYDVLHRSELMKTTNPLLRGLLAFMNEPFKQFGQAYSALHGVISSYHTGDKTMINKAWRHFAKTVVALLCSLLSYALLSLVANAAFHRFDKFEDDKGNVNFEGVLSFVSKEFFENGAGYVLPVLGPIAFDTLDSWISGEGDYFSSVGIPTVEALSGFKNSLSALCRGQITWKKTENLFFDVGMLFGIPLNNAKNILNAIIEWIKTILGEN